MVELVLYLLVGLILLTAFFAVFTEQLVNAVIALSLFSSSMVVIFLVLQAPDVALAEIVIDSGLATGFFIIAIDKTGGKR